MESRMNSAPSPSMASTDGCFRASSYGYCGPPFTNGSGVAVGIQPVYVVTDETGGVPDRGFPPPPQHPNAGFVHKVAQAPPPTGYHDHHAAHAAAHTEHTCLDHQHQHQHQHQQQHHHPSEHLPYDIGLCSPPIDLTEFPAPQYDYGPAFPWSAAPDLVPAAFAQHDGADGQAWQSAQTVLARGSGWAPPEHQHPQYQQAFHGNHSKAMLSTEIVAQASDYVGTSWLAEAPPLEDDDGEEPRTGASPVTPDSYTGSTPSMATLSPASPPHVSGHLMMPMQTPYHTSLRDTRDLPTPRSGDTEMLSSTPSPTPKFTYSPDQKRPQRPRYSDDLRHQQYHQQQQKQDPPPEKPSRRSGSGSHRSASGSGIQGSCTAAHKSGDKPPATTRPHRPRGSNREAAKKCREKMKVNEQLLEDRERDVVARNDRLRAELGRVIGERNGLRDQLLAHANCGDPNIDSWLSCRAHDIGTETRFLQASTTSRLTLASAARMRPLNVEPVNGRLDFRLQPPPLPPGSR